MSDKSLDFPNIAIVGAGLIGRRRAISFASLGCEIRGVFDLDEARATTLAAEVGSNNLTTLEGLFEATGEGGVVVVATTHCDLPEIASAAIEVGCHVLLEKPGAMDSKSLEPLLAASNEASKTVRVGFNHRFHPGILAMKESLQSSSLGEVLTVRATYGHGGRKGYETEWRFNPALSGGGELLDQGSHLIDLSNFLLTDNIELRYSHLANKFWGESVEDNAFLHASSSNSKVDIWLHASWTEWKNRFNYEVFCTRGKLVVEGLGGSYGPERFSRYEMKTGYGPPEISTIEYPPGDDSWKLECEAFLSAVKGEETSQATLQDAIAVLRVIDEAYHK